VIQETLRTELPEGFQTSEFLLERGFIDRIVPRAKLRVELGRSIRLLWTYDKKTLDSFNVEELSTTSKPETVATLAETKVIDTVRGLKSSGGEASQAEEA
jgi:acetyl-CoA carboxylase beta subunit